MCASEIYGRVATCHPRDIKAKMFGMSCCFDPSKTAAGMIAPRVGITLPTVAPMPQLHVRHGRHPLVDERGGYCGPRRTENISFLPVLNPVRSTWFSIPEVRARTWGFLTATNLKPTGRIWMSDSQAWKAEIRSSDYRASGLLWSVLAAHDFLRVLQNSWLP